MKTKITHAVCYIAALLLVSTAIRAQDITGQWNGALNMQGTSLRVVFNITRSANGYSTTMDSPDQGAKGIPVTSTTFVNGVLKITASQMMMEYKGTLGKETFTGTFTQRGHDFPLTLSRKKIEKALRKQDPVKPYPYRAEEVQFENTKDKIILSGTLTLPDAKGNYPAVVLISGSGAQNRDEEIAGHKPFLVLADHLTKNGFAVLRFDDRGTFESKGDFKTATSEDFATDVEAAVTYLKTRSDINSKKIGLIGHSEGGIIAPMIAAHSSDISYIVLLAGTGIRGKELLLLQKELIERASGEDEKEIGEGVAFNAGAFDIILKCTDAESAKKELTGYYQEKLKTDQQQKPNGMSDEDYINAAVNQLLNPWMMNFIKYDPSIILKDVKCPVLALNGTKDLQVPFKENLMAIKNNLEQGGNKNVTIKELDGLNHLFQECEKGTPDEYVKIEQTFSPVALNEISVWLLQVTK